MLKAIILFFIFLFTFTAGTEAARNISITSDKSSISLNDEMTITASHSGFTESEKIYLKGAFYKDGSSNYFGYTKVGSSWIKNSATATTQKEVVIGSWDNSVVVKLDYEDTGFIGVGDYKFKLGFYYLTGSGNTSSVNWSSNVLSVGIDKEPSPTPEPESASVSSSGESYLDVDNSPTPKPSQTVSATVTGKNNVKSVKITDVKKEASQFAQIKPIERVDEEIEDAKVLGSSESIYPKIYLFSGLLILAVAAFIFVKREIKERNIL